MTMPDSAYSLACLNELVHKQQFCNVEIDFFTAIIAHSYANHTDNVGMTHSHTSGYVYTHLNTFLPGLYGVHLPKRLNNHFMTRLQHKDTDCRP